ncbi:MAG: tetratricopeptide repeat protein [Bacteroidetes bacterium]|nr:tetratricopeptide repeat protein [Bacteroidota bacterium]
MTQNPLFSILNELRLTENPFMNYKNPRMRNRYSTLLGLMLLSIAVISTSCKVKFEEPKKLFDQGYYRQSAVLFEEFSKTTKDKKLKEEAIFFAAEAYRLSDEYDKAARLYDKVLKKDPKNTKALLMRANMLKKMELYREALDAYDMYLAEVPGDTMADYRKQGGANDCRQKRRCLVLRFGSRRRKQQAFVRGNHGNLDRYLVC